MAFKKLSSALLLVGSTALAQPTQADVVPPQVTVREEAHYPDGATDKTQVVLEVLVDTDVHVAETKAIDGTGAFATEAMAAVSRWKFKPATRAGKPVRARIHVVVDFTPPPPPKVKEASEPPKAPPVQLTRPGPLVAPLEQVEEVRVSGRRETQSPTEHRVGRAEIRVIPGAFGDPFRAIDILPGVVPIISGLPYFYIRGSPPSAAGFYVDDVRVPYLFHFALGPGVIHPAMIEEVSLHPAAYPARYGRYAGGIIAGQLRDPPTQLRGEAQIRLYDAGIYGEAPIANGRGTVGLGGRYSYTGGIISLIAEELTIDYRDYNARASYQLNDRWRASAVAFGAYDYASDVRNGVENVVFASEFHRLDMRFDRRGADGATSRVAATVGIDRTRIESSRFAQDWVTGVRARHRWPAARDVVVELGGDLMTDYYSGDLPSRYAGRQEEYRQAEALFAPRVETATGIWASASYYPRPGWDFTATMRGDAFTSAGKVGLGPSPRLSVRIPLVGKLAFLSAMGVAPQPPTFSIPVPAVGYRGLPGGMGFAYQKSAGLELGLPWRFTLRGVGFHHSYFNLRDFARDRDRIELENPDIRVNSPTQAFGLEMMLSRKLSERFSGFASFTLTRAVLGSTPTEPSRVSPFDRTYVLQVGGVADLGRGWRISSRFLTYRGWPYQPQPIDQDQSDRLSPFRRVDVRFEKRWTWSHDRWIALVLEGLNVTLSKDVTGRRCERPGMCEDDGLGPIVVPSLGVEGGL